MKKILVAFGIMLMGTFAAPAANADSCGAGYYYNDNNECVECQYGNYCTGDGTMQPCPEFTYDNIEDLYPMVTGYNVHSISKAGLYSQHFYTPYGLTSVQHCVLRLYPVETDEGRMFGYFLRYSPDTNSYSTFHTARWVAANAGYYLSNTPNDSRWFAIKPCTNAHPANSHYSGPGTPDSADGTVVDANDCPWECDSGYYAGNGACVACPTEYTSDAGATAENQCYITVTGGHYIGTAGQTSANWGTCAAGYYKPEHNVNYGSTSSCTACDSGTYQDESGQASCKSCPAPATHKATTFPEEYYVTTITSAYLDDAMAQGAISVSQCRVMTWLSGIRGNLYARFDYNESSEKYDIKVNNKYGWLDVNAGYYLTTKGNCSTYAYYKQALPCPAGAYCAGKTRVSCNSTNQATVHTTNFGLESCPENSYCPAGAAAPTACAAGLYSPTGMWAANQCGHILHIGDEVVYLHGVKKTSPSLHVKIGNDIFYGNMTTSDVVMHAGTAHKLKVQYDNTTYSIYDDTVSVNQ